MSPERAAVAAMLRDYTDRVLRGEVTAIGLVALTVFEELPVAAAYAVSDTSQIETLERALPVLQLQLAEVQCTACGAAHRGLCPLDTPEEPE